jgi:hypothetical protein
MPRLKQYTNGRGYYLSGHIPDVGFCTWQIGRAGLEYLSARGLAANGDLVPLDELQELIRRGLVGTDGSGTSPAPPPQWVGPLAERLIGWARTGGVDELVQIVCPNRTAGDHLPRCFPPAFLSWARGLDSDAGLARLAGLSAAEFEALAAAEFSDLRDAPLFEHLTSRGAAGVLWRLARVVGAVAVRSRAAPGCPPEWEADPLLGWLYREVESCLRRPRTPAVQDGRRKPAAWRAPEVVWEVDLQEVRAFLPAQPVPAGVTRVEWRVGQQPPLHPLVRTGERGRYLEESESPPLPAADGYRIDLDASGGDRTRWDITGPADAPILLFHTDGRLIYCDDPDPLTPSRYLGLVRPGRESAAQRFVGVKLIERIPVAPVGWSGWTGWHLDLLPGANLPGYQVAGESLNVGWELEPPPSAAVYWLESAPVYLGRLPRLRLSTAEAFRGSVVEVFVEGPAGAGASCYLALGSDVPIHAEGDTAVADLNSARQLLSQFGRFRLRCQPGRRLDQSPLALTFCRLPELDLRYVPDPVRPAAATALRVVANPAIRGAKPGPDSEIVEDDAGLVVRSVTPESAPGVYLRSAAGDWELRVRIGVTRAGIVGGRGGFTGWRPLPIRDLDLARVELGDRLRVEFHTPPVTEVGRLVSRLPGRGELFVGEPLDRSPTPTVFEIALHRWRDGFGVGSTGVMQIRGGAGWVDVVVLTASEPGEPAQVVRPTADAEWQRLAAEMDDAVAQGERAAVAGLITRCLDAAAGPDCSPCATDLLPIAAARAALAVLPPSEWGPARTAVGRLCGRDDLPEAVTLAAEFQIRGGGLSGADGEWSLARVEELDAWLPATLDADVVRAECWYRLARASAGPAPGCWRSCLERADRCLASGLPETGIAFSDVVLLRDLARMMLGFAPAAAPDPARLLQGHRGWVRAVRYADRFMRRPWHGRTDAAGQPDLAGPAPSVLCPEDEALIRVVVGLATGCGDPARHWSLVAGLPDGYFYALPLLRARYARAAGDPAAGEEYARAWAAFQSGEDAGWLDLIAEERP